MPSVAAAIYFISLRTKAVIVGSMCKSQEKHVILNLDDNSPPNLF